MIQDYIKFYSQIFLFYSLDTLSLSLSFTRTHCWKIFRRHIRTGRRKFCRKIHIFREIKFKNKVKEENKKKKREKHFQEIYINTSKHVLQLNDDPDSVFFLFYAVT